MSPRNPHSIVIVRGHVVHRGAWSEREGLVHLESAYGAAEARAGHSRPEQVAKALLARLVERTGGQPQFSTSRPEGQGR